MISYSLIRDMKKGLYIFLVFGLAFFTVSCSRQGHLQMEGQPIEFRVSNVDVSAEVKSVLDQDAVNNQEVYVYATRDNAAVSGLDDKPVSRDAATGRWSPATEVMWNSGNYVFYGYTSSGNGITVTEHGKRITVTQPESYSEQDMSDYLLSYTFTADGGTSRPIVTLALEHAMSLIEIRVVRSPSILDARLESLTVSGFYRSATMTCASPAAYRASGARNSWSISYTGTRDGNYSLPGGDVVLPSSDAEDEDGTMMRFMAVPQTLSQNVVLTVEYTVNEKSSPDAADNYQRHSESFVLQNYSPAEWANGHRVVYMLTVDTGIHLQGMILPWKNVDMIEGTVLPEL